MARKGALAVNPPLRGQARKDFRAAQREAVASGGPMPTQAQFRPQQPQQPAPRPPMQPPSQQFAPLPQGQFNQQIQDYMYRYPQPSNAGQNLGNAVGAVTGAATGMQAGNIAGSRSEGMRNPFEPQNNSYWFQGKPNMPGYMGPRPQGGPSMGDAQATGGNTGFAGGPNYDQLQQYLAQIQQNPQAAQQNPQAVQDLGFQNAAMPMRRKF